MKLVLCLFSLVSLGLALDSHGALFFDTFSENLQASRWTPSEDDKFKEGVWEIEEGPESEDDDKSLIVKAAAKHNAISAKFDKPLVPAEGDVVVQYEVRFDQDHSCGGAYLKVLQHDAEFSPAEFKDDTPFIIMFGPDKCGSTDKVHFIFRHKNPVSGEYEEKHMTTPPTIKNDRLTHLYTLVMRKDNTFEIFIDQKSVKAGSLLEDFDPPVNPPAEIDDPEDEKPKDWVDEAMMDDPEQSKPADWDEDAPQEIDDTEAVKPEGWLDDGEDQIPDPEAEKPEDWDEEDDGAWEPPLVDNPVCKSIGCGVWKRPQLPNPDYKGKWYAPQIENPAYKGEWKPRQIPNKNFFEDKNPHALDSMGAIGIEIWTMQDRIEFDNVWVGSSESGAKAFGLETWAPKNVKEAAKKAEKTEKGPGLGEKATELIENLVPENLKEHLPIIGGGAALLLLMLIFFCCFRAGDPVEEEVQFEEEAQRAEDEDEDADEDEDEDEKKPAAKPKKRRTTKAE